MTSPCCNLPMEEVIEMPKYMWYSCPCGKCWNSDGTPVPDLCKEKNPTPVHVLGMPLQEWKHKSCEALFAEGDSWATMYSIESKDEGKGHAEALMREAKAYYEARGKTVGGTVALSPAIKHLYQKLSYIEYD